MIEIRHPQPIGLILTDGSDTYWYDAQWIWRMYNKPSWLDFSEQWISKRFGRSGKFLNRNDLYFEFTTIDEAKSFAKRWISIS